MSQSKAIALQNHLDTDYFIYNGVAYYGDLDYEKEAWELHCELAGNDDDGFDSWIESECIPIGEEIDQDYLVLTDSEADTKAGDSIKESLWAFNADFLAGETGLDSEVFSAIQGNSEAISCLIAATCGLESFIDSAIGADGRGHFIAPYDFEENEINVEVPHEFEDRLVFERFYIYRVN